MDERLNICVIGKPSEALTAAANDLGVGLKETPNHRTCLVVINAQDTVLPSIPHTMLIVSTSERPSTDLVMREDSPTAWRQIIQLATRHHQLQAALVATRDRLGVLTEQHRQLMQIGIMLSAEKNLHKLLDKVLYESRRLAHCEGASLFLVERDGEQSYLRFVVSQNANTTINHENKRFPLSTDSIAGYSALTGKAVKINDVYQIPKEAPYRFNAQYDKETGYRTRDMVAIPMHNHRDEIIGVLQLLNSTNQDKGFPDEVIEHLQVLASQAAVAIENSQLMQDIERLFEGFVLASVKAIEARDPVTSGHSFRVADYTLALAQALPHSTEFREVKWRDEQLKELRYAALLHDFGKVGVREHVLLKAQKLPPGRLELLLLRIDWLQEHLQRRYWQQKAHGEPVEWHQIERQLAELDYWKQLLEQANQPTILPTEISEHLAHLVSATYDAPWGQTVLDDEDFLRLSVTKGSLTEEERQEIQSHVLHSLAYLREIPWTPELSAIPDIAAAHHEKLDGSGYPFGLRGDAIPLQSRMMTIADIYDALTARDRPYKAAVPIDKALDILMAEADRGLIDRRLLRIFIESRAFQASHPDAYSQES